MKLKFMASRVFLRSSIIIGIVVILIGCKSYPTDVAHTAKADKVDYSVLKNWAAHPDIDDNSDRIPASKSVSIPETGVDIFFIHPTIYTSYKGEINWNADINDQAIN